MPGSTYPFRQCDHDWEEISMLGRPSVYRCVHCGAVNTALSDRKYPIEPVVGSSGWRPVSVGGLMTSATATAGVPLEEM